MEIKFFPGRILLRRFTSPVSRRRRVASRPGRYTSPRSAVIPLMGVTEDIVARLPRSGRARSARRLRVEIAAAVAAAADGP